MVTKVMQTQAKDTIISTTNNRHNYVRHLRNLLAIDRRHSIYSQHSQQDLHLQPIGQQRMRVKIRTTVRCGGRKETAGAVLSRLALRIGSVSHDVAFCGRTLTPLNCVIGTRRRPALKFNISSKALRYGPRHFPAKPHVTVVETVTHQIQSGVRGRSGTVKKVAVAGTLVIISIRPAFYRNNRLKIRNNGTITRQVTSCIGTRHDRCTCVTAARS